MSPQDYFNSYDSKIKKQYDALREFFHYGIKAHEVAIKYEYTLSAFYSLVKDFRVQLGNISEDDLFFRKSSFGRKPFERTDEMKNFIINLRKQNFSADDIVCMGQSKGYNLSYHMVYQLLTDEGFAPLFRRSDQEKNQLKCEKIQASRSQMLTWQNENFVSNTIGLMSLVPYIKKFGLDQIIIQSQYPQTKVIDRLSSILSFVALKTSDINRYSSDDLWCMDRGTGLFAGLNVLPKTAWFSSYSDGVTRDMNTSFLKALHGVWLKNGLLSDTINLDFTTVPYWGSDDPMENNWSGKRNKALASMLVVLAQNPDSGLIDYGDTTITHKNQDAVVLEFLDFYKQGTTGKDDLKYLVFDSKFTNYGNLSKLDDNKVKFITIRRRGKSILEEIQTIDPKEWKKIRVECASGRKRHLKVHDSVIYLKGYNKNIRQIVITGNGKIKPALIITNDFDLLVEKIVRKYSQRWLVEKTISEQIEFFHLNRNSSGMVIKVDFDLTMSILAHNLYRLFALDLERYKHCTAKELFEKFTSNSGTIKILDQTIEIQLKKKRNLPLILETMQKYEEITYEWLGNKKIIFSSGNTT